MLLYVDPNNEYLAVAPELRFVPTNGYRACFHGRDVPEVICRAYVRQYGGRVMQASRMPTVIREDLTQRLWRPES